MTGRLVGLLAVLVMAGCNSSESTGPSAVATSLKPIVGGEIDDGHPAVGGVVSESGRCTGTLVTSKIVLTAAHCINPDTPPTLFTLGQSIDNPDISLEILESIPHPLYVYQGVPGKLQPSPHDIALLVLAESAPLEPMKMRLHWMSCLEGTPITFVGFGLTDKYDPSSSGIKHWVNKKLGELGDQGFHTHTVPGQPQGACSGDSGGPALLSSGGQTRIIGVASTADHWCALVNYHVRTDTYADWILEKIAEHDPGGLPALCGDGFCEFYESEEECPDDCQGGEGLVGDACETSADCQVNLQCQPVNGQDVCTKHCPDPDEGTGCGCGRICVFAGSEPQPGVGWCAMTGYPASNCGNGKCEAGENFDNCPPDCLSDQCNLAGAQGCCQEGNAVWCHEGVQYMENCAVAPACGWDSDDGRFACGTDGADEPTGEFAKTCPSPGPKCGNAICESSEDMESCPLDCPFPGFCGDGECAGMEYFQSCPADCKKDVCKVLPEKGCCDGEVATYCYGGDQFMVSCTQLLYCGWDETTLSYGCLTGGGEDPIGLFPKACMEYLPSYCGDGECDDDETEDTCPADCAAPLPDCGDGTCGPGEDYANCPKDCFDGDCGLIPEEGCCDGDVLKWCEGSVFMVNCEEQQACGWSMADGYYSCGTAGEEEPSGAHPRSCDMITNPVCGDDYCQASESEMSCPQDCKVEPEFECGNGICEAKENEAVCPEDCGEQQTGPEQVADMAAGLDGTDAGTSDVEADPAPSGNGGSSCAVAAAGSPLETLVLSLLLLLVGLAARRSSLRRQ